MTDKLPHQYSLLDLCGRIHGACTGSGDGVPSPEAKSIYEWLRWRVADGWKETRKGGPYAFDSAVRSLCIATLSEMEREAQHL